MEETVEVDRVVDGPITIIMPVRRLRALTEVCVESIRQHSREMYNIIIIDNACENLHIAGSRITVMPGDPEWGFAESCNYGAQHAIGHLLFINNDVEAVSDFVPPMARMLTVNVGIVGALLFYPNGTIQHCGASYNKGNPNHPHKGQALRDVPEACVARPVESVTGACMLVNHRCWRDLGGFDAKHYPFAYEDVDFCFRARDIGWETYFCPDAQLIHLEHKTQYKYLKQVRPKSDESLKNLRERWGNLY